MKPFSQTKIICTIGPASESYEVMKDLVIAGMDVMRPIDKQNLQSKLNSLGSKLKIVAAGDFSNSQLVNSVGGMATSIIKDSNIQAAVQSTANARKQMALIEEARQKGELTPDKEWFFQRQLDGYLSNNNLVGKGNTPVNFNGKYLKHYDIDKDVQDAISKAHLSSEEWEENAKNPDGLKYIVLFIFISHLLISHTLLNTSYKDN